MSIYYYIITTWISKIPFILKVQIFLHALFQKSFDFQRKALTCCIAQPTFIQNEYRTSNMTTSILQIKGRDTEGKCNKVILIKRIFRPRMYAENPLRNRNNTIE